MFSGTRTEIRSSKEAKLVYGFYFGLVLYLLNRLISFINSLHNFSFI